MGGSWEDRKIEKRTKKEKEKEKLRNKIKDSLISKNISNILNNTKSVEDTVTGKFSRLSYRKNVRYKYVPKRVYMYFCRKTYFISYINSLLK